MVSWPVLAPARSLAMSQDEQLALGLTGGGSVKQRERSGTLPLKHEATQTSGSSNEQAGPGSFLAFALACGRIGADAGKLEKVRLLAKYFRQLRGEALALAATWFTGRPFPASQNKVLQLGWALLRDAVCAAGGVDETVFHQVYLKHSDLGETASEILAHRPVRPSLSLERVGEIFNELNAARGRLAKTPTLKAALEQCTAVESKYFVKIITGDLRIGLKEGLVEEAVAGAFARQAEEVRRANLLVGDIGETAKLAAEGRLGETVLVPFRPVKFMLASPEETAADVWKRMQENLGGVLRPGAEAADVNEHTGPQVPSVQVPAAWLEDKYDGIRCQMHKVGKRVALYSRDLKDITSTFLEVVDSADSLATDFVLDGEMVAMRGEEVLPFAELQKRLGRRQGDLFMREEVPIVFVVFDCLWRDGTSLLDLPLRERRSKLEALGVLPQGLRLAPVGGAHSAIEIQDAFKAARARGNEGLMIKDSASPYTPGRRGLAWLKLKEPLATLDCVVIGAEYGHGKRSKVLSDYTFAVRDEQSGELKTIGKAYTGLTDAEIANLTQHFLETALHRHGRYFEVPPDTVLEIAFDRLQLSDRHPSGLAMRFPRIVRIRTDKTVAEIDTLETARKLAKAVAKAG
jgi:DNA ligase-1